MSQVTHVMPTPRMSCHDGGKEAGVSEAERATIEGRAMGAGN